MARKKPAETQRARQVVAQEAARIIVNQGIRDYRVAKFKAAERLGLRSRGALPGNAEIERAVSEHLELFGRESHARFLAIMRRAALAAMELLHAFRPRLVGPVLSGTADASSAVNLHLFADSAEAVAAVLADLGISYRAYERRLKSRRDRTDTYAGYAFHVDDTPIEATIFPVDGIRQAPISSIDGRPIKRADSKTVLELLD